MKDNEFEEKEFELGDKYTVACRSAYYSPADSKSTCIVATKAGHEPRAIFDFEVYKGKVEKAEVALNRALIGTTIDKDGKTNGELQPEHNSETIKNIKEIQDFMKLKKSDWQVVSVIPIQEYEENYQKAGKKGDYLQKWGTDIDLTAPLTDDTVKKMFRKLKLGGK